MSDTEPECIPIPGDHTGNAFVPGQQFEVANREAFPFRHVKNLGHGSSAVIVLVAHKSTDQLFAFKTFRRYHGPNFESVGRAFKNEVNIMERLSSHSHIVQIQATYRCGTELGILLSPAASDGDLAAYLTKIFESGLAREQEAILNRAFGCLANGLAYIHKHTIRHKDVKPQNILIHDGRVVYTDFGISFDAEQQDTTTTIGFPGRFTRRYCAPEVQDWANRNRKSDVYSLGCVFAEILDVLEPQIGLRSMDRTPYFEKLDGVRRRLAHANVTGRARRKLLRICHDMLDPDQVNRIDTSSVVRRVEQLSRLKDRSELIFFCDDCSLGMECKDMATQEELEDEFTMLSLDADPTADTVSPRAENEATITMTDKERKKKKRTAQGDKFMLPRRTFSLQSPRYHCTTCGELGHKSSKCPNECWACNELYHKSTDCPNKCWACDEVGHYEKDCPNECDACGEVGHQKDNCPDRCWTCGDVGHFARDCEDECFVCGMLGHGTQKCMGKCHKCGKIGHWKRDCDDACFECGELGHWAARCPRKRKKGKHAGACYECGESGHWAAQCPEKQRKWRPIFEQVPRGPYRVKSRLKN